MEYNLVSCARCKSADDFIIRVNGVIECIACGSVFKSLLVIPQPCNSTEPANPAPAEAKPCSKWKNGAVCTVAAGYNFCVSLPCKVYRTEGDILKGVE